MTYHIQETIFPDRHTVAVMNPSTGEFLPVAEIIDRHHFRKDQGERFVTQDRSIRSAPGETLQEFASMVAKFLSPFERLRPSDYTGSLFD